MPLQATSGAASQDAFGGNGVAVVPNYIEDVFSTYLYAGTGAAQSIVNNIDLSIEGGLVWIKSRTNTEVNTLQDTLRGTASVLVSNLTNGSLPFTTNVTSFNSNGFSIGTGSGTSTNGQNYVSWTFRKQPKFFDVVTYTGSGSSNRQISHAIGGTVGCVIVKRTDSTGDWMVYHQGSTNGNQFLNQANGGLGSNAYVNGVSSTTFTVSSVANTNAATYVAYVFAHNAGGFGLTGTENVITCGSYTGDGTNNGSKEINLGFEPQFLIVHGTGDWVMADNMRCMNYSGNNVWLLRANTTTAEGGSGDYFRPTATGFKIFSSNANANASGTNYIYIAIRRPMKVPTTGTSVFSPIYSAASANTVLTTSFPVDLQIPAYTGGTIGRFVVDRLRGVVTTAVDAATSPWMKTNLTDAETTGFNITRAWDNTGYQIPQYLGGATTVYFNFRRAPGFFDEVCYTGTGSATTQAHNLGVVPELMIIKSRGIAGTNWAVYSQLTPTTYRYNTLQTNSAGTGGKTYGPGGSPNFEELSAQPTSTVINLASSAESNASGRTFVAYLFATCAGVSKVGSYTGNGSSQTINCGFTGGARFVLIKATSTTGDWMVSDSARGIIAGSDPYLELNNTNAEVTGEDWLDTDSTGFVVNEVSGSNANTNGVSYIFLAIA